MKSKKLLLILVATVFTFTTNAQTDTLQWTAIFGGTHAGFLKKWKTSDGYSHDWFQYNDRGRGDSTVANYKEDPQGFIIELNANGKDYFKKSVFEKFKLENGTAAWENNAEKGTLKLPSAAAYIPLKITAGTSYRNFFATPDSSVTLIPSGKQKLKILKEVSIANFSAVRLFRLSGTGLTPSYGWMDKNHESFANVSEWFSLIKKGFEGEIPNLLATQNAFEQNYFKDIKQRLTKTHTKIAIINATVFDPQLRKTTPNQTILIVNGVVQEVSGKK
jgi:hypothetical protein